MGLSIGFMVLRYLRTNSFASLLLLFYLIGQTFIALIIKTVLLQPVESNLYAPRLSYEAELVGIIALSGAAVLAGKFDLGRPIFIQELDPRRLGILKWGCIIIGVLAWIMTGSLTGGVSSGPKGFGAFTSLIYMSVICKTAQLIIQSGARKYIDMELALQLLASVILGLLDDSKGGFVLPLFSYLATVFSFTGRVPWKIIFPALLFAPIFVFFVGPLIHVLRFLGEANVAIYPRLVLILKTTISLLEGGQYAQIQDNIGSAVGSEYYNYFGTHAGWQIVAGRYASVQQIDPIIWRVHNYGTLNLPVISQTLRALVPQIIIGDKQPFVISYYIISNLGFLPPGAGKYPTLPMIGELYAVHGMFGMFSLAFGIFLLVLLAMKKAASGFYKNVVGIFIFVHFVIGFASQGEVEQYIGFAIRDLPSYLIIFMGLRFVGAIRLSVGTHDAGPVVLSRKAQQPS